MTRYLDGWSAKAIAGYLETSRATVYDILRRWAEEGWPGLADRPLGPRHPAHKVDLRAMAAVRRLQGNPELGEFRIHAALAQQGIHLSPRTCGRILALHRALGAPKSAPALPHDGRRCPSPPSGGTSPGRSTCATSKTTRRAPASRPTSSPSWRTSAAALTEMVTANLPLRANEV